MVKTRQVTYHFHFDPDCQDCMDSKAQVLDLFEASKRNDEVVDHLMRTNAQLRTRLWWAEGCLITCGVCSIALLLWSLFH